jgi:ribosomal protein L10
VFERSDNMKTVSAKSSMIAVVHYNNVTVRPVRAGDARKRFDETLWRLRFPVPANL